MDSTQAAVSFVLFGTVLMLNQDAAVGAAFGSAFFLLSSRQYVFMLRAAYAIISAGLGYAAGVAAGGDWAMLSAIFGAAGAIAILEGITVGGEPNAFIKWLVDVLRGRK